MIMERYTLNPVAKTLIITAAFAKAIQDINSEEYALYTQLMADIPNLEVVRKTHKTPTNYRSKSGEVSRCNQFKNLTYENMETFMVAWIIQIVHIRNKNEVIIIKFIDLSFIPFKINRKYNKALSDIISNACFIKTILWYKDFSFYLIE